MELTTGKISNYVGQAKDENKDKVDIHLRNIDTDLQNIFRLINRNLIYVGDSKANLTSDTTKGFSYIPLINPNPLTTPTAYTGHTAIAFVNSNSSLYIYNTSNNAWKVAALT